MYMYKTAVLIGIDKIVKSPGAEDAPEAEQN